MFDAAIKRTTYQYPNHNHIVTVTQQQKINHNRNSGEIDYIMKTEGDPYSHTKPMRSDARSTNRLWKRSNNHDL